MSIINNMIFGIDTEFPSTMIYYIPLKSRILIAGKNGNLRSKLYNYIKSNFFNDKTEVCRMSGYVGNMCNEIIDAFADHWYNNGYILVVDDIGPYYELFPYMDYIFYLPDGSSIDKFFFNKMNKNDNITDCNIKSIDQFLDEIESHSDYDKLYNYTTYTYIGVRVCKLKNKNSNNIECKSIPVPDELKIVSSKYIEFKNAFIELMIQAATNGENKCNYECAPRQDNFIAKLSQELSTVGYDIKYTKTSICVVW